MAVYTDANHLHQVVWNLSTNAVKYVDNKNTYPIITISAHLNDITGINYLDIIATGPGVSTMEQDKLFESFYTTRNTGTGLGLYISRELCLSNDGDLTYSNLPEGGSRLRIRFAQK